MASSARKKAAVNQQRPAVGRNAAATRKRRTRMLIDDVTAILLVSPNAKKLCEFYRATLGIPLEEEVHDGMPLHYGYALGDVQFAIHPADSGWPRGSNSERAKPSDRFQHFRLEGRGQTPVSQWYQGNRTDGPWFCASDFVSRSRWEFRVNL
jgi:hypothetical protein